MTAVLDAELAESEFERLLRARRLVVDLAKMGEIEKVVFDQYKQATLAALIDGRLVVEDDGVCVFTPADSSDRSPIKLSGVTGATFLAGDGEQGPYHQQLKRLSQLSGKGTTELQKLHGNDFFFLTQLLRLFLI